MRFFQSQSGRTDLIFDFEKKWYFILIAIKHAGIKQISDFFDSCEDHFLPFKTEKKEKKKVQKKVQQSNGP